MMEGFAVGINDDRPDALGGIDGREDGTPMSVGLKLGWLDGWPNTEGFWWLG